MNWPVSTFQRESFTKLSRAHSDKRFIKILRVKFVKTLLPQKAQNAFMIVHAQLTHSIR